ncbi:MAG: ThiF family adenylyltransferase [Oceanipulchritudo sp.]
MNAHVPAVDFSRQSFLGDGSQSIIERTIVGVVGLGGGGSHIVQQLAHMGFLEFVIFDSQSIEASNLNRLIGATQADVDAKIPKVKIAERLIKGIRPHAKVEAVEDIWQRDRSKLIRCDVLFGCVDGLDQRRQLERTTRRYLIPLIDIGMDVYENADGPPSLSGQVVLSMPGTACLTCMGFLNQNRLATEAAAYRDAGINPQVVWANGILASTAVAIAIDLLTDWTQSLRKPVYLSLRGNHLHLTSDPVLAHVPESCSHFPIDQVGSPRIQPL